MSAQLPIAVSGVAPTANAVTRSLSLMLSFYGLANDRRAQVRYRQNQREKQTKQQEDVNGLRTAVDNLTFETRELVHRQHRLQQQQQGHEMLLEQLHSHQVG